MFDYEAYAVALRRELHEYPEIGYDLPKTLAVIRRELDAMGIPYTEKFGESSIVATINEEKSHFTIGIRGDMDALPVQEQTELPFASKYPGKMHACGHDLHTAGLIATARKLNDMKDSITCCVKLLFTPAEEYETPGCKGMVEDGVMDDIDCIISLHVDPAFPVGTVMVPYGGQGGNSMGFTVEFYGETAHASQQHKGKDAIAMAVQAYVAIETMVAKEFSPTDAVLVNIGSFHGGNTNNIICDYCKMFGSARTMDDGISQKLIDRITEICNGVAAMNGAKVDVKVVKFLPYVVNHPVMSDRMQVVAEKVVGKDKILTKPRGLGGEDFSFLCRKKPGIQFRLGTNNEDPRSKLPLHNARVIYDEGCFKTAMDMFVTFVLDNMNGITFEN